MPEIFSSFQSFFSLKCSTFQAQKVVVFLENFWVFWSFLLLFLKIYIIIFLLTLAQIRCRTSLLYRRRGGVIEGLLNSSPGEISSSDLEVVPLSTWTKWTTRYEAFQSCVTEWGNRTVSFWYVGGSCRSWDAFPLTVAVKRVYIPLLTTFLNTAEPPDPKTTISPTTSQQRAVNMEDSKLGSADRKSVTDAQTAWDQSSLSVPTLNTAFIWQVHAKFWLF